jgi:hypothetical protein
MDEKAVIRSQLILHGAKEDDLDSRYDYHYERSQPSLRGHELCYLPSNCWKIGVNAAGKYPDGDGWLDAATGWPCAFHGTPAKNITSIIAKGLLINGGAQTPAHGAIHGKGVYVSPMDTVRPLSNNRVAQNKIRHHRCPDSKLACSFYLVLLNCFICGHASFLRSL